METTNLHGASDTSLPLLPADTVIGIPASKADFMRSSKSSEAVVYIEILMTEPRHPGG